MMDEPTDYQRVEILIAGEWLPAVFIPSDDDENHWWNSHYMLDDGRTVPADTQDNSAALPPWRLPKERYT